jgi:VIT1/CCC1 family predicted Fe2+/Mn2+ transporter
MSPAKDLHREHHHRNVQGGAARAAVFGVSDGLVSNVSLILGMAGADAGQGLVRVAGLAGLVAGAVSMAAGEYVSMAAQRELLEHELELERRELQNNPQKEIDELAKIYEDRGIAGPAAVEMAEGVMADPDRALEVHAREELGLDPAQLGNPIEAALSSFVAFAAGAALPLLPWFFGGGTQAVITSIVLGLVGAIAVGAAIAIATGRPIRRAIQRQVLLATGAAVLTYLIGSVVGTEVG